jgi:hypothetical protein
MLFNPILGFLFSAIFAVPIIIYGVRSARSSHLASAVPSERYAAFEKQKPHRAAQEMYQDTLTEFVKSFGVVRGTIMLENRIKAYINDGLSKEEAIRKLAEDIDY